MKLTYISTILASIIALNCNAQNFSWVKTVGASSQHYCGTDAVVTDSQNNVFSTGHFAGVTNSAEFPISGDGTPDVFVIKRNTNGTIIWSYYSETSTSGSVSPTDIAIAPDGSIVVVGSINTTNTSTDFNPNVSGGGISTGLGLDCFILKLNPDGSFNWVKKVGGDGFNDMPNNVQVDANGNIYVVGKFNGIGNYSTSGNSITLTPQGNYDGFILKLDSQGNSIWANSIGGTSSDEVTDLTLKPNGEISTTGYFSGSVDFDPTAGQFTLNSNSGSNDIFVTTYNSNGTFANVLSFGGPDSDYGYSIDSDQNGKIYLTGTYFGNVDFDPSASVLNLSVSNSAFNLALDETNNLVFANSFNTSGGSVIPEEIRVKGGIVYLCGIFISSADFNPSTTADFTMSTNSSLRDIYICKLTLEGSFLGAYELNTSGFNASNSVTDMCIDESNSILLSGFLKGTLDVDPGVNTVDIVGGSYYRGYTIKLEDNCVVTSNTISTSTCGSYTAPDGQIYTQSGSYSATIPNALGCDSVITINLTLTQPTTSTISPETCLTYTAPDGQVYTQSGNYTATIPNASGCDSLITINLTIHQNSSSTIAPSVCGNYIAPDGQTYTQSGTYSATISNSFGCDSVITINLTIQNLDTGVSLNVNTLTANANGSQYQWIDCATNQLISGATQQSFTPTYNGNFAVIVSNENCSDTSICTSVSHVSLIELSQGVLSVQPNPTNGVFTLKGLNPSVQNRIILYTISGEVLTEMMTTESEVQLNLEIYAPGMYFINCDGEVLRVIKR